MGDIRIRKNENCVINLPACDFVFSSSRSCFIGYGFSTSKLEVDILKYVLSEEGIEPIEAGSEITPGQYVFCTKICSKIITSQFCIILLNDDNKKGTEQPNANVNLEYGLMLGFNKYVIPFQKSEQNLPFNVSGFDTVKYSQDNFKSVAQQAIRKAKNDTQQKTEVVIDFDRSIESFLLSKNMLVCEPQNEGERNLVNLGLPCGFKLLNDFSGMRCSYFGAFQNQRPEQVVWRYKKLSEIILYRFSVIAHEVGRKGCAGAGIMSQLMYGEAAALPPE